MLMLINIFEINNDKDFYSTINLQSYTKNFWLKNYINSINSKTQINKSTGWKLNLSKSKD